MKGKTKVGALLVAGMLIGNAYGQVVNLSFTGNGTYNLGTDPSTPITYAVNHPNTGLFTDTYDFSITGHPKANASYTALDLTNLLGITASSFNLYTSGGTLINTGTLTGGGSAGTIGVSGLTNGSYYYQLAGDVTGSHGGSYLFAQVTAPVPEPSTYALMFMGLCAVGYAVVRQRRRFMPQMGLGLAA
jgi:PEP-CTERM motif